MHFRYPVGCFPVVLSSLISFAALTPRIWPMALKLENGRASYALRYLLSDLYIPAK